MTKRVLIPVIHSIPFIPVSVQFAFFPDLCIFPYPLDNNGSTAMKPFVFLLCIVAAGCATFEPPEDHAVLPQVIDKAPLPPLPRSYTFARAEFMVRLRVMRDGSVGAARLLTGSGVAAWDSAAAAALRQWRFTPALWNGRAVDLWIDQRITVLPAEPVFMLITGIVCESKPVADSLYAALASGGAWERAAQCGDCVPFLTARAPARIDINRYGEPLHAALLRLQPGGVTPPVLFGRGYVIVLRLREAL